VARGRRIEARAAAVEKLPYTYFVISIHFLVDSVFSVFVAKLESWKFI
jgi:hypothetical protein